MGWDCGELCSARLLINYSDSGTLRELSRWRVLGGARYTGTDHARSGSKPPKLPRLPFYQIINLGTLQSLKEMHEDIISI